MCRPPSTFCSSVRPSRFVPETFSSKTVATPAAASAWRADGAICTSACALAWLGGSPRRMGQDAHIDFYEPWDPSTRESSSLKGEAAIANYIRQLGLPYAALLLLLRAQTLCEPWCCSGLRPCPNLALCWPPRGALLDWQTREILMQCGNFAIRINPVTGVIYSGPPKELLRSRALEADR